MALSVSGQMNNPKAAPVGQLHSVVQWFVDERGPVAKHRASASFHYSADAAGAAVGKPPVNVGLLRRVSENRSARRAGELLDAKQISGVVDVAVGKQDRLD